MKHTIKNKNKTAVRRCAALLWAVGLLWIATGCSLLPVEDEPMAAPVLRGGDTASYTTYRVARGDLTATADITTSYIPTRTEGLAFAEGGLLFQDVLVEVGSIVRPGQVLITLESEALDLSIEALERQLVTNRRELADLEDLYAVEKNPARYSASSRQVTLAYSQKKNDLESAGRQIELELSLKRHQKSQRVLVAGIGGVVTVMQDIRDGDRSVQGEKVLTIADKSSSAFLARSGNHDLLTPGMEVEIRLTDVTCRAQVVVPQSLGIPAEEPGAYLVLLEEGLVLRDNAVGTITLVTDRRTNVLQVPASAIHTTRGETFVYVLSNNIRVGKPVTIGLNTGKAVEILAGLDEGEEIVV